MRRGGRLERRLAGWELAGAGDRRRRDLPGRGGRPTGARNVPLNNRLAQVEPADARAAAVWDEYLERWTAWNHVRTVTSLAAAVALTVALTL